MKNSIFVISPWQYVTQSLSHIIKTTVLLKRLFVWSVRLHFKPGAKNKKQNINRGLRFH